MARRKTTPLEDSSFVEKYRQGRSALSLANESGLSLQSVIRRLKEAGVLIRRTSRVPPKTLNLSSRASQELKEIVDGLMLGDGYIDPTGVLRLAQCLRHEEWVRDVESRLTQLGVPCRVSYAKEKQSSIKGRLIKGSGSVFVYTPCYLEFKEQRQRWYPGGMKRVPQDISLTPLSLSLWFCGDGTSSKSGLTAFCAQSFPKEDIDFLLSRLWKDHHIKADATRCGNGFGYMIQMYRRDESFHLRQLIEPYIPSVFHYKLTPIRPAIPKGKSLRRLTNDQVEQVLQRHKDGETNQSSGLLFGVSGTTIGLIVKRKLYKEITMNP